MLRYIGATCIIIAMLFVFEQDALARGCSATVNCYCSSGTWVHIGSRDVDGECKGNFWNTCCSSPCDAATSDLKHAIGLCNESYGQDCEDLTISIYTHTLKIDADEYTITGVDEFGETATITYTISY